MTFYETKLQHIRNSCFSNEQQLETVIGTRNYINNNYEKELNLDFLSNIQFTLRWPANTVEFINFSS